MDFFRDRKSSAVEPDAAMGTQRRRSVATDQPKHGVSSGVYEMTGSTSGAAAEAAPANVESELEANEHLAALKKQHIYDPNLPEEVIDEIDETLHDADKTRKISVAEQLMDNSPYPEVRSAVRNYDEDVPANTLRAWVLGMLFTTIGAALNMLFSMRQPAIIISTYVAQLVSYPVGVAWAKWMPAKKFRTFGFEWSLNPGPFNMKEHTLMVIMANVSFGGGAAYSTDTILAQRGFYKQNFGWGFELLLTFTTQILGFGIAGMMRRFLVWPAAMIWPQNLINTALFYALHDHRPSDPAKTNGWSIGRYKWFLCVFTASFIWYWFPGYIAQFLSVFAFVTWIRPNNVIINQLFGGWTGVSLIPLTFDWTQITGYTLSPLIYPWYAIANTLFGTVIFYIFLSIGLQYSNKFYSQFLPMSDSNSYDNTRSTYNVSRILTPDYEFNVTAYKEYSPLFLSTTFSISYALSFAAIAALITHTALYHEQELWTRFRQIGHEEEDVHTRLMKKYKDSPSWWYIVLLVCMIGMSLGTVLGYPTHMSWWAFFVAIIIATVWFLPIGIIQGATNIQLGLNVFTEFLIGYMSPGKPVSMMLFKTYGYISMYQGLAFIQDLKLGHYMKVPPRVTFAGQIVATIWSCIVQIAVLNWALGAIKDVCSQDQANHFSCPGGRVFFNASIIWGVIGPQRIFSPGNLYSPFLWMFLVGALTPFVTYTLARLYPRSIFKYVNVPIIFGGMGQIPPATPLNYLSWGIVGFIFNKWIKDRWRGWWMQYNYVTSAALDSGLSISTIVIFCCLSLTLTDFPSWWGNDAPNNTLDSLDGAIRTPVASGQTFGPTSW